MMSEQSSGQPVQPGHNIYMQFTVKAGTGQLEVSLVDENSGQVIYCISSSELQEIVRAHCSAYGSNFKLLDPLGSSHYD